MGTAPEIVVARQEGPSAPVAMPRRGAAGRSAEVGPSITDASIDIDMASTRMQWAALGVPALLRLVQTIVLARLAGPEVLGVMWGALVVVNTLPRLIDLGLPHAAGYFLRRDPGMRAAIVRLAIASGAVGGMLSLPILFTATLYPFADAEVNALIARLLPLLCVYVGAQLARDLSLAALVALERVKAYFAATVLPVALGPLGLLAIQLSWEDAPVWLYTTVIVSAELLGCTIALYSIAGRSLGGVPLSSPLYTDVFKFGLRAFPAGAAKIVSMRADRIILAALLPPSAYAVYALSLSFRDAMLLPSNSYGMVLLNKLTKQILAAEPVGATVRRAMLLSSVVVCVPLVSFTLLGPALVPWVLGPEFADAVPIMSTILWSAWLIALSGVLWTWMMAAGRPGHMSVVTIASSVLTVGLVVPFTASTGIAGAALAVVLATAGGLALSALATWHVVRRSPQHSGG
jgi:O-antigen/teichoic acid export membrane protein